MIMKDSFAPQQFAAPILLHISIFFSDIFVTRRLIYYKAMTETRGAEMHRGDIVI